MFYVRGKISVSKYNVQLQVLVNLVNYFDATYVTGTFRSLNRSAAASTAEIAKLRLRRLPALFPPEKWNVFQTTVDGSDRTSACHGTMRSAIWSVNLIRHSGCSSTHCRGTRPWQVLSFCSVLATDLQ